MIFHSYVSLPVGTSYPYPCNNRDFTIKHTDQELLKPVVPNNAGDDKLLIPTSRAENGSPLYLGTSKIPTNPIK
jgi:hypothetical protein